MIDLQNKCIFINSLDNILPAFENNNIPVIFSSSDFYLPYCAVTIKSMLNYTDANNNYDVFIMTTDISSISVGYLDEMIKGYTNVSIRIVKIDFENINELFINAHVSKETYLRLLVPWIFNCFKKIVFVDSDMIFKADVSELYKKEIGNNFIAAVPDIVMAGLVNGYPVPLNKDYFKIYLKETLKMKNSFLYFNAGVMLMNIKKFRDSFCENELIKMANEKDYSIFDQDVLNLVSQGNLCVLGYEWNFMPDCTVINDLEKRKYDYIKYAPHKMLGEFKKSRKNVKLIHYTDQGKPWFDPYEDMADEFWEIARETPFFETILFRLYENNAENSLKNIPCNQVEYVEFAQQRLFRRTVKRIALIFLPYGTKRRSFAKKIYFKIRGWEYIAK